MTRKKNLATPSTDMVDLVDKADKVIGRVSRDEAIAKGLRYRIVHVLLVNDVGNILVQWRKAEMKVSPRTFTASAAGGVDAGEDYEEAATRELKEELGVTLKGKAKLQLVGKFRTDKGRLNNGALYAAEWNGEVKGWESEADAIDFWSREEAEYMLKRFPYLLANSFQVSLKLFLKETA